MRSSNLFVVLHIALVVTIPTELEVRDTCKIGYALCAPTGASTNQVPTIGDSEIQNLFIDIVRSSLPPSTIKRGIAPRSSSASLCCISSLSCLSMFSLAIPFCYDRFTTNYFLPDGSYGTVVGGGYWSSSGAVANLLTGAYTLGDGTPGNIYAGNEAAIPNLATLSLPTPFTASGVGTAIPASVLGLPVTLSCSAATCVAEAISANLPVVNTPIPETSLAAETPMEAGVVVLSLSTCSLASAPTVVTIVTFTSTIISTSTTPFTSIAASTVFFSTAVSSAFSAIDVTSPSSSTPPIDVATSSTSQTLTDPASAVPRPAPQSNSTFMSPTLSAAITSFTSITPFTPSTGSMSVASVSLAMLMALLTGIAMYIS